jgi:transcriptional regulator with XRE-family HTH domain
MKHGSAAGWKSFADVVTERKAELGLSFRELERKTKDLDRGRGLSAAYLVQLFNGNEDPVPRAMRLIAGALELAPDDFVEYRLHLLRDGLDERVDFERAVENLKLVESLGPDVPARLSAASPNGPRGRRRYAAAS